MFEEPVASPEDLFSIFEGLDGVVDFPPFTPLEEGVGQERPRLVCDHKSSSSSSSALQDCYFEADQFEPSPKSKRLKMAGSGSPEEANNGDGQQKVSHITVERNRRKQMNEHLSVLRSLMPCFYVKRGDQASIIGGVVDYINELQQVLNSLEAKKQRKVAYTEVLSPRLFSSSPRPSPLSPRKPPVSPRLNSLPISPRTPQPGSPYKPWLHQPAASLEPSPSSSSSNSSPIMVDHHHQNQNHHTNELVANSKSAIADVEVKFSGPNVLLKTVSPRIPGQVMKIIAALEDLSLEILHVNISTVEETMLVNSFTIKIGIECQLSVEELAQQIQQTFC